MSDAYPGRETPTSPAGWASPGQPPLWGQPLPDETGGGRPGGPPRHHRRGVPVTTTALLVVLAAGSGIEIGHVAWKSSPSANASAQSGVGTNGQMPSVPGGGYSGGAPFGSGGPSSGTGTEGSGAPTNVAAIAAKISPALVDINSTFNYQSAEGAGTGIVLTSNGEILTNNHVIDGATKISVTDIGNGKTYNAGVVGYDPTHDIAVLQLQGASNLRTAALADSSKVTVGEPVVAVGNAGGTGGTPSHAGGSVTALNQSITASDDLDGTSEQLAGLIEVNADVQAGDSGGSLVNSAGQVIGMDAAASAGFSFQPSDQSSDNQGFAIPINQALATARQIEAGQGSSVVHVGSAAFLGVLISSSSDGGRGSGGFYGGGGQFGGGNGGGGNGSGASGAVVSGVVSGTSAQQIGVSAGDVITSLGGRTVDSASTLSQVMISYHPGDRVQLGWTDGDGQAHTATVDLGSGPPA
jgi:S1-C subfamily serine protease